MARLSVVSGRVNCPNRGNIAVDICLFCDHLTSVDLDCPSPVIFCRPPRQRGGQRQRRAAKAPVRRPPRSSPGKSPVIPPELKQAILEESLRHPRWGAQRIAGALRDRGVMVSVRKVLQVFTQERLNYAWQRMERLEWQVLCGGLTPNEEQVRALEAHDPCFRERQLCGSRPGERVLIFSAGPVGAAGARSIARVPVHVHFAIDTFSGYAFGLVQAGGALVGRELLWRVEVASFLAQHGFPLQQVHPLEGEAIRSAFAIRLLKAVLPKWLSMVPAGDEVTVADLQRRLDAVLSAYNRSPVTGFPNMGQPPICRLTGEVADEPAGGSQQGQQANGSEQADAGQRPDGSPAAPR